MKMYILFANVDLWGRNVHHWYTRTIVSMVMATHRTQKKARRALRSSVFVFLSEWNVDNNRNHTVCHGVVFVTTKWPSDDIYIYQHVFFIPPLLEWLNPDRAKSGYLASTNERTWLQCQTNQKPLPHFKPAVVRTENEMRSNIINIPLRRTDEKVRQHFPKFCF